MKPRLWFSATVLFFAICTTSVPAETRVVTGLVICGDTILYICCTWLKSLQTAWLLGCRAFCNFYWFFLQVVQIENILLGEIVAYTKWKFWMRGVICTRASVLPLRTVYLHKSRETVVPVKQWCSDATENQSRGTFDACYTMLLFYNITVYTYCIIC